MKNLEDHKTKKHCYWIEVLLRFGVSYNICSNQIRNKTTNKTHKIIKAYVKASSSKLYNLNTHKQIKTLTT